ncbi:MAG: class I SAM-dependent methyltransferase [Candidatus Omnitrophota bacterium]|nr:class I SAM-dependent methyltransferase [Candidatus Omnitrophota bacterium]
MPVSVDRKMIELGMKVADLKMCQEDKIWSRYSNDKVDIGEQLARVIRTLSMAFPLSRPLRALSIGSSDEPQFRILETAFRGGLYLFDVDGEALELVKERICRQNTDHVRTICGDYKKSFLDPGKAELFVKNRLHGKRVDLITLHHSLYYCRKETWHTILQNLYRKVLAPKGAVHVVLMDAETERRDSTTWLYNHFVYKFFGCRNDQDLIELKRELKRNRIFRNAQILSRTNDVRFFVDDFEKFMAVIWMILLYPQVHTYSSKQKEEVTRFVFKMFWQRKKPLIQLQDHLVIYRGIGFDGLI